MTLLDIRGNSFHVGCEVVRALDKGVLDFRTVTRIDDNAIYLNNSPTPVRYPRRLLITKIDPLYKMVKTYEDNK